MFGIKSVDVCVGVLASNSVLLGTGDVGVLVNALVSGSVVVGTKVLDVQEVSGSEVGTKVVDL